LQFVTHAADQALLRQTLAWKSNQYLDSGKADLFAVSWIRAAVERIQAIQIQEFKGTLSVLYAGDRLLAGHFGMQGRSVWHYWFPAYDPKMARYSPGLILLLKMAEHASSLGVHTIDLGKGLSLYKRRLMNVSVPLASGSVELPSWRSLRRHARRNLRSLLQNSPLGEPVRDALNSLRQLHGRALRRK
jgi:CelD/BcsL family acetyltransferase involved in cellulose biosynthesis